MEATWGTIANIGAVGGVLIWFMFKSEPRLRAIEASIDRLARALLLLIISIPQSSPVVKDQARSIIGEIDESEKKP